MDNKNFLITTIIPIYNIESYLEDTIKSVINQTINFKKNIQLILVNDGSKDKSEEVCLKYKTKYPKNILYINQKNSGVSAARNNGFKYAKGKYINFCDGDDILDKDAYEKTIKMLENNPDIDVAALRLKFFEASNKYHWLDYKYTSDRIVDINKEPESILLHISCSVIRKEAIKENPFDTRLKISEDTKVLYEIIMDKCKYGLISSSLYNYRKRFGQTSAIQTSRQKKYWYLDTLKYCQKELIQLSKEKFGRIIEYLQYFIIYDIKWRLKANVGIVLNDEEKNEYVNIIYDLLQVIDDDVIINQINMSNELKMLAFKVKYKNRLDQVLKIKEGCILINDKKLCKIEEFNNNIEILRLENNFLHIDGHYDFDFNKNIKLYYCINDKEFFLLKTYDRPDKYVLFSNDCYVPNIGYTIDIDVSKVKSIELYAEIDNVKYKLENTFYHFSMLSNFKLGYYYKDKYLFTKNKTKIFIKRNLNIFELIYKELLFEAYIGIVSKNFKIALKRLIYHVTKPFYSKNIWLFCDREFMARDSAELMFKYVNKVKDKKIKTYFIVDKRYPDYKKMKKYGNVASYHSLKYEMLFLNARYLISSHADGYVNNAFDVNKRYLIDLYNFKYIYLTHGILLHDSSKWLNRINKNISLNVVTSPMEYESIINGNYYFNEKQLMKSGLPRYDNLFGNYKEENKILFMPSWRSTLVPNIIPGTQRRLYNPEFVNSEYFKFYDRLFNDKRLLDKLKEKNLKIKFCIHPSFREQMCDFKGNEFVEIAIDVDSQYETQTSKCIVTDYSSAACDFAYLRKPVIYANFDLDHIYDVHYYNKGYFDYDEDGFGPNCKTYDETIENIIKVIDNNFVMEKKYESRCNKFFYYNDNKNCERVYNEIMKLDKKCRY